MKASIIIAFYNNIRFLRLVLAGFERQSEKNFEIVIADDGSHKEITDEINDLSFSFPMKHIWHEDVGWRKNMIMNKSIQHANSDYLIFIDSDCIPHRHFVKEHLKNREKGKILSGRRLNLSDSITQNLTIQAVRSGYLEKKILTWLFLGLKGEFSHAEKGLYLPALRPFLIKKNRDLLGCNFSVYATDFLKINGFDERYQNPTVGEDTDVEYRATLAGLKIKSVRNLAIQYHLYHKKLSRKNDNHLILEDTKKKRLSYTPYGIIKEKAVH